MSAAGREGFGAGLATGLDEALEETLDETLGEALAAVFFFRLFPRVLDELAVAGAESACCENRVAYSATRLTRALWTAAADTERHAYPL